MPLQQYFPDDWQDEVLSVALQHEMYRDWLSNREYLRKYLIDAPAYHYVFIRTDAGRVVFSWSMPTKPLVPGEPEWAVEGPVLWIVDFVADKGIPPEVVRDVMKYGIVDIGLAGDGQKIAAWRFDEDAGVAERVAHSVARKRPEAA